MDCSPAKKRRLMERLNTIEPMDVDPPESDEKPMEVDLKPDEEPMEVDPPPPGQSHHQPIALRKRQKRARPRAHPYYWSGLRSTPPPCR